MTTNGQPHADTDPQRDAGDQAQDPGVPGVDGRTADPSLETRKETATGVGGSDHRSIGLHQRDQTSEPGNTEDSNAPLRLTALMNLTEERPPKIGVAIRKLNHGDNAKDRNWFEELLRQTVPERAWEILQLDDEWQQVLSFAVGFGVDHFPLCEDYLEMQIEWWQEEPHEYEEGGPYSILRDGIPFQLMGFTWDELHAMWEGQQRRNGLSALALLMMVPQEAGATYAYEELLGMRQAWLESAADKIPEKTLRRIPEGGITLERLEKAVKGTHLEAAHLAGMWFQGTTGTFFLDNFIDQDEFSGYSDPWEEDNIEYATTEWRKAKDILDQIEKLTAWLEEDLPERFEQMLELILGRLEEIPENSSEENSSEENSSEENSTEGK